MKSIFLKGKPLSDEASKVCILYDPDNGRVVHVHGVTIVNGAKKVSNAGLEQRAMKHAKTFGRSVERLKTLHLPFSALRALGAFKVNSEGTGLVPLRAPPAIRHVLDEHRRIKAGGRS